MYEVRLAGSARLSLVMFERKIVGLADDFQIVSRAVFGDLGLQLLELGRKQLQLFLRSGLRVCRHVQLYSAPHCGAQAPSHAAKMARVAPALLPVRFPDV